jgi:hypothetical protein
MPSEVRKLLEGVLQTARILHGFGWNLAPFASLKLRIRSHPERNVVENTEQFQWHAGGRDRD